ncbi:MAG: bifunctional hydroxymethylpyrimidine kinase/phosphomethylpyrimidine kinase [Pseudomonadota bacterium]
MTAIALTIAGSDSGGGAGIQADLKTFSALGVYGASVLTAVTAQNTRAVTAVQDIEPDVIAAQIEAVCSDLDVGAIKIGMLSSVAIIDVVAQALADLRCPIVLDPVMVAKSGDALLASDAVLHLRTRLLPLARVVTPNLPEAAQLLGSDPARTPDEMAAQADALRAFGAEAVLMKGGHADGDVCTDVLVDRDGSERFDAARVPTRNTHGTGCTLSSAIAAHLARGLSLSSAVAASHRYLHDAIRAADTLTIGSGHGPVHHFHAQWSTWT